MIKQTFGATRLVYNLGLTIKQEAWKNLQKNASVFELINQLPDLKREYKWLAEVDSQALQASVRKLDVAFVNFFRGAGHPKFKNKRGHQSFHCPSGKRKINWDNNTLSIPKINGIPIVLSRRFSGKIRAVTISKTPAEKYYASILVENGAELPTKAPVVPENTIGIDLGLRDLIVTSGGVKVENQKFLRDAIERLKILQRRASKKKKGSANRKKANLRVALQYEKVRNQRQDSLHKLTSKLVSDNQVTTFCLEDLNVSGMVKNHKLAAAIADVSWSEIKRQLKYKSEWAGKNVLEIGRFEPSTKTCSGCGIVNETLTLADREWVCAGCGTMHNRDINAAINIKNFALAGLGKPSESVEQRPRGRAKKQKPVMDTEDKAAEIRLPQTLKL